MIPRARKFTEIAIDDIPADIATVTSSGNTFFQNLPPHLQERFYFDPLVGTAGALVLEGEYVEEIVGESYLLPNLLSDDDVAILKGLSAESDWATAIDALSTTLETFRESDTVPGTYVVTYDNDVAGSELAEIVDSDSAVDSYALTAVEGGSGYVTLIAQDGRAFTPEAEPVAVHILKVDGGLYTGQVKPLTPSNPLSEQVSLQHTGDFAGELEQYEFEWVYSPPVNGQPPALPGEAGAPTWLDLGAGASGNRAVFGGGAQPLLTLGDNYVTMRYRPVDSNHAGYVGDGSDDSHWSDWTDAALVEGWIKRVLGASTRSTSASATSSTTRSIPTSAC